MSVVHRVMLAVTLAGSVTAGCTWVEPHAGASTVRLATDADVRRCELLGNATAQTADSITIFNRSDAKIASELADLARNEAVKMSGNTVVASSPIRDGAQSFNIYRCP